MRDSVCTVTAGLMALAISGAVLADRKEDLVNPIPYAVVKPAGHIDSPVDPETIYDNKRRGFVDSEPMPEIEPYVIPERQLPPPTVVPYSDPAPVERVVSAEKKAPPLKGEDRIFEQIARDQLEIQCTLDDTLDQCEGIEIEAPKENKPRSHRVIDRQIQASGTN
ncbi:hypothetical protein SAMN03080615_03539 [Amphritea atlantica]|uniref:Uncharacterized protein n=1 Tax=Amphritea atlantica TaxID=355243 RepID=A0A1H9KKA8_9GAMM|nr:hypothetical protein [Amphritea atlantica]SEQ99303.1 hypothetical protein SAMN03080615_03539 [Amphritea atlantica]